MAIEANTGLSGAGSSSAGSAGVTRSTWANFPAASSVAAGTVRMASDYNNSEWVSDGTYWKPRGGRQRLFVMAAAVSSTGTTSEVNVWAPTIPAGMLFPMCSVEFGCTITKTGTAGTTTMRKRYNGAAGTIIGYGNAISGSYISASIFAKVTAGVASGGNLTLTQAYPSQVSGFGGTATASVGVTHTMANAVTMNLTLQSGGATDTINITNAFMEICG
jgi:hypothetical protein